MGYRDEREALRQRVDELERELAETQAELRRGAPSSTAINPLVGGPTRIRVERELPGELDEETIAKIVAHLRREVGEVGRLERIGSSVAWSTTGRTGRLVELTLETSEGGTRLRVTEPLHGLVGSLFGGLLGGLGGGGIMLPMIPLFFQEPLWLLGTIPAWLGSVYLGTRALYARTSRKRHAALERIADEVAEIARAEVGPAAVRARVETPEEEEVEQVEEEAERAGDERAER